MNTVTYQRNGITIILSDDTITIKKNGLTIDLPTWMVVDFCEEFDIAIEKYRYDLAYKYRENG